MLNVESVITQRFPDFCDKKPVASKTLIAALRYLFHEKEFQQFEKDYPHAKGFDFVEQVLSYFDFDYAIHADELENIPATGRVVVIANHPIGSLDGLAIIKLIGSVRKDVKIIAN